MAETLNQCERDVEQARSKLAQDLATLRSPATFSSFTNTVKHEVFDTKDAVVAQAKDAVQSSLADFVEGLKADRDRTDWCGTLQPVADQCGSCEWPRQRLLFATRQRAVEGAGR
jgi:hypothetical protein